MAGNVERDLQRYAAEGLYIRSLITCLRVQDFWRCIASRLSVWIAHGRRNGAVRETTLLVVSILAVDYQLNAYLNPKPVSGILLPFTKTLELEILMPTC